MNSGTLAGLLGALGVAMGAFGAHALRGRLEPADLALFETAARHQLAHALAALFAADRAQRGHGPPAPARLFLAGILLFSGSLYALALGAPRAVGAITPFGGLAFILGWLGLAWTSGGGQASEAVENVLDLQSHSGDALVSPPSARGRIVMPGAMSGPHAERAGRTATGPSRARSSRHHRAHAIRLRFDGDPAEAVGWCDPCPNQPVTRRSWRSPSAGSRVPALRSANCPSGWSWWTWRGSVPT